MVYRLAGFAFALMQRALTLRRCQSLAYFNLSVVDVRQKLVEVAHVEPFSAARALHEMIGFGHAVKIDAAIILSFRHPSRASFRRPQW
jgi:hypothetical protein